MLALPDPNEVPVLSVQEAGELLGISKDSAYRAANAGEIPTIRIGKRILVPTAKLRQLLGLTNEVAS